MSGTCKPNEQEKRASEPLSISQVKNNPKFSSIHIIVLTFFSVSVSISLAWNWELNIRCPIFP